MAVGKPGNALRWLFSSEYGASHCLVPRWLFLRALGVIYFSAFFSLFFQIRGLIGPAGILPASEYLEAVSSSAGHARYWYAPTLLWLSSSSHMLMGLSWVGLIASVLLVLNMWPRGMLVINWIGFLSFVAAAAEFSGYQSDGMLLEAGFISFFLAPPGLRPGIGRAHPPMRASVFLLLWEWFRIYFESGVAKIASGDPEWRHFTAMDEYYQNGPLPTWIGWYVQHLPHWFHVATAYGTLGLELVLVWLLFLPRRFRILCFIIVTPWQIGVILTANYAFLNYLVLVLAFFLLDDQFIAHVLPHRWREFLHIPIQQEAQAAEQAAPFDEPTILHPGADAPSVAPAAEEIQQRDSTKSVKAKFAAVKMALSAVLLTWIFYATTVQMLWMLFPSLPFPQPPVVALDPFRIAGRYGLFAVMTRGRYEIEFQGSNDGQNWKAYPFRFKPQDPDKAPGIYAPYQPRFEWNLWFASLEGFRGNPMVIRAEERLLESDPDVLSLFASNPFPNGPPRQVRAVLWQYWFTSAAEKRTQGLWWRREFLGLYAPTLERDADGDFKAVEWPSALPPRE